MVFLTATSVASQPGTLLTRDFSREQNSWRLGELYCGTVSVHRWSVPFLTTTTAVL
jgi:hypothetical protein